MLKPIAVATGIAGTLDLLAAFILAGLAHVGPLQVLLFVASGPFGDGARENGIFALAGLLVHYGIMAVMASVYILASRRLPLLAERPVLLGALYGLGLWIVMYWIVRPLRWPEMPLPYDPIAIAGQLFCHLVLVGIPIAVVAARHGRTGPLPAA